MWHNWQHLIFRNVLHLAGGSAFVIRMWLGAAAVPVHAIHLAFDVGALIAPQIVRPFLGEWTEERTDDNVSTDLTNSTHVFENPHDRLTQFASTDIEYPYAIIACLTLAGAAMFVVLFSFADSIPQGARLSPLTFSEIVSPTAWCDADDPTVAVQMVPTLFFAFLLPSGTERAYARFVFALAVTGRTHMAPADAAMLETVFWASFAIGLVSAMACAHWVAPLKLLLCQVSEARGVDSLRIDFCERIISENLWYFTKAKLICICKGASELMEPETGAIELRKR